MKTGATLAQIEAAARRHFDHINRDRVLPPWPADLETSEYHQHWIDSMEWSAQFLVPEDKRIIDIADLDRLVYRFDGVTNQDADLHERMTALAQGDAP